MWKNENMNPSANMRNENTFRRQSMDPNPTHLALLLGQNLKFNLLRAPLLVSGTYLTLPYL